MAGYSWINSMNFTHPGTVAIGAYKGASKERGEKKARQMKFDTDQKMLDKLTMEIANLPSEQEQQRRLTESQIGASAASTEHQKLLTQLLPAQIQAQINSQNASAAASSIASQGSQIENKAKILALQEQERLSAYNKNLYDKGITNPLMKSIYEALQAQKNMQNIKNLTGVQRSSSENIPTSQIGTTQIEMPSMNKGADYGVTNESMMSLYDERPESIPQKVQEKTKEMASYAEETAGTGKEPEWMSYIPDKEVVQIDIAGEMIENSLLSATGGLPAKIAEKTKLAEGRANEWTKTLAESQVTALNAARIKSDVKAAIQIYEEVGEWEKGELAGLAYPIKEAAKNLDTQVAKITLENLEKIGVPASDADLAELKRTTISRAMGEETFRYQSRLTDLVLSQSIEYPIFLEVAQNRGVSPQSARNAWIIYLNKNPAVDILAKEDELINALEAK